jgi:lipopolysaccharide transport system ATP-binding protein
LLAQVYKPSRGRYISQGKITSLLNINLGMDLDDTGLENIRNIGMFLGMSKQEIMSKRDDVIEFSELGDYIHLPLRTYSAGMLTRLSFALATAVEKDILLMDEGIGAGDAAFADKAQKRLNGFYKDIGILVIASHADGLIKQLCNKAILLEHGRVKAYGEVDAVLEAYRSSLAQPT